MIQRHPLAFALALALLVALPTLTFGFWVDDYYHLAILEYGEEMDLEIAGPFDLFYFAPGDPEIMREAMNQRPLPWFTLPELHLHFFRPLTSALFTLDHTLWGLWALPYHVHSVLWYLVLICAVWWVYRRVLPWGVAMLATVLFTIDDVHTIPVAWIANRNGLLAVAFVFLGFAAHLAWRRDGKRWGLPASVAGYVLGLCAGEAALGAMVYVVVYELAGLGSRVSGLEESGAQSKAEQRVSPSSKPEPRNPIPALLPPLLPICLTTVAYLLFYKLAGYGVSGSGMYLDPMGEPLEYLRVAPERILSLVGAQVLAFPAEISLAAPVFGWVTAAAGVAGLAVLFWLLWLVWPSMEARSRRAVFWLIAGGLLGLIPVAATFPSSRLLMAPSFGFAGAVALVLWHGWTLRRGWGWPARAALVLLAFVNCIAAPAAWWAQTAGLNVIARFHDSLFQTAEIVDDPDSRLVFLRAPEPFSAFYTTAVRALYGHPMPQSTWSLSLSPEPQVLRRVDVRSLELSLLEGRMLDSPIEQLFRTPRIGYTPGDVVELEGLAVTILETDDGFPTKVRFTFDEALESGLYQFLQFEDGRLVQATPPPIGEDTVMPQAPGVFGIELKHLL